MNNRGVGLLGTWVSVALGLFALYIILSFCTPMLSMIDFQVVQLINNPMIGYSGDWLEVYNTCVGYMRQGFQYFMFAALIGLVIYAIIAPVKKEYSTWEEEV